MAPLKKKRIQIRKFPVTQYQADALKQLCPPENITVSEWAENYRVLDSKTSALPGPWRNEKTPYLKEIMDELINYDTERIIFVKPTQVGGTEALQNMLGYVIQQDPSPTMIVYPTDILAKSISENRLEPMIMATRTLKSLYNKNESSQLELQFDNNESSGAFLDGAPVELTINVDNAKGMLYLTRVENRIVVTNTKPVG